MDAQEKYEEFLALVKKGYTLLNVEKALCWDEEVIMAPGGVHKRALQKSVVSSLKHETLTGKEIERLLEELKGADLTENQQVNVREVEREFIRNKRINPKLIERLAMAKSKAFHSWREARKKKDFSFLAPDLKEIIELTREYGKQLNPEKSAYENLVHEYEPYIDLENIKKEFQTIKEHLIPIIKKIEEKNSTVENGFLQKEIPKIIQKRFNVFVCEKMGFDFNNGRLDVTTHPLTLPTADVRITTRYDDGWFNTLSTTVHEAGHGLYEQGLPDEHYATPRGMIAFFSVDESQSRLWENILAKNKPFWEFFFPFMQQVYPPVKTVELEDFLKAINMVHPTCIRLNADELAYPLHIILRLEIEEALMEGSLEVEDLPRAWNEKMEEYLGIVPPNDAQGVLQDVHWIFRSVGYFPTYLIGNMIASQLYEAAKKEIPGMEEQFRKGDFSSLLNWLRKNIHEHGRTYTTQELVKKATGNEPRSKEYLQYLENKYTTLYDIKV